MAIFPRGVVRSTSCLVLPSTVGFSGSADGMALFPVSPNRAAILENSNCDISAADRSIYSVFGSRMVFFGVGGSNGAISSLTKFNSYVGKMREE